MISLTKKNAQRHATRKLAEICFFFVSRTPSKRKICIASLASRITIGNTIAERRKQSEWISMENHDNVDAAALFDAEKHYSRLKWGSRCWMYMYIRGTSRRNIATNRYSLSHFRFVVIINYRVVEVKLEFVISRPTIVEMKLMPRRLSAIAKCCFCWRNWKD